jgi:hypothetical protein
MATELQVFGYDTHSSAANLAKNAVMRNRLPHGLGRSGHWVDMLGGVEGKVNFLFNLFNHNRTSNLE